MEKQKKNDSGITLVALVVSVIVMLVLAGVSLNATVGENGIVTRAQEAALKQRVAEELENLNLELTKLNVDTIATDETMAVQDIANYLVGKGTIDSFVTTSAGQIAAGIDTSTGNKYFFGKKGDNTYRITRGTDGLLSAELTTQTSGGDITGGYALITEESFNNDTSLPEEEKGKFTITDDAEVVFMDTVSGALSIYVKSGVHATVGIYANMTLTNANIQRSAITIEPNGMLDMYVGDGVEVVVNSGIGQDATLGNPGKGGYAGINVPEEATLNIHGSGTIKAYGGKASMGETQTSSDYVSGGGGAGAGIGGNGGDGGLGQSGTSEVGKSGYTAGNINIYDSVNVYAYGGAGGSGSVGRGQNSGAGGGYPAAGIGGGGAGAGGSSCCGAGGGYSGGGPDYTRTYDMNHIIVNGHAAVTAFNPSQSTYWGTNSSSYYFGGQTPYDATLQANYNYNVCIKSTQNSYIIGLGGLGGCGENLGHLAGNGGQAGSGGIVKVSKDSHVYAFNGNRYSDGTDYNSGENEAPIYLQRGIIPEKYQWKSGNRVELEKVSDFVNNASTLLYENILMRGKTVTINENVSFLKDIDLSHQGVGSGAGYIEVSNGEYGIYNVDSNGNFTTVYTGE